MNTTVQDPLVGRVLDGRYHVEARLARGGMATVYRALDSRLDRVVALKVMHPALAQDDEFVSRFIREARSAARLSHPNVVTVIDAGEDEGHPYIVFEYVDGETLKDRIRRQGRLPIPEAVAYAIEICRALGAAHAERLVHRDVKPQNVLIDAEGRAKVTDFGIARSLEMEGLTAAGRVLGTTDYVSPEQALGELVTEQSDLYSLGICLYEMLTGDIPYKADTQVAVAMKHVRDPMPDVQQRRPEVSALVAAIVERATAKETVNRYGSADEMARDLEEALAIEAARAGETTGEATSVLQALPGETADFAPRRLRSPRRALVTTLLVGAIAAALVVVFASRTERGTTGGAAPKASPGLSRVTLEAANDYDPAGDNQTENPGSVNQAIDENRITHWQTETYVGARLGKPGVGLYLEVKPTPARQLRIITPTPGWDAEIYAADDPVPPTIEGGWTKIAERTTVEEKARIDLDTRGRRFRRYLIWIVKLPAERRAQIQEVSLLR